MKRLLFLVFLFLASCKSLNNFQEQPVIPFRDINTFKTTCNGMAEEWGSCYRKANRTCAKGYKIVDKQQDSTGIERSMIFSCK